MKSLEKYFKNISGLYDYQDISLQKILEKKNTLTIAPTGGGKSLIFQLAALEQEGTTIVISPLKALMDEQVQDLKSKGIKAVAINSDMTFIQQRELLRKFRETKPKLLYVSPERLFNYFFRSALLQSGLEFCLVVIDEAHCISQWGIDFRPEYGNIMPFIKFLMDNGHNPVISALTATMGDIARKDIKIEFRIDDSNEIISDGVIRSNLKLNFIEVDHDDKKMDIMLQFIEKYSLKKVLVYLYSQKKCEELSADTLGSDYYHAGMTTERKADVMNRFKKGEIRILYATTAFGMGINIPDIDGVIHYQIPESVEEYYQHVGRGARDVSLVPDCKCLMLWSETNFYRKIGRIKGDTLTEEDLIKGFQHLGLENKQYKKTYIKYEEIYKNDGSYGSVKLALIKRMFEKYEVCKTVGDIYGNPLSIKFKKDTELWNRVLKEIGRRNQYIIAEMKTGIPLEKIIDHVYEQEILGNVEKLPATERILFLESLHNQLPKEKINTILEENSQVESFRLARVQELKGLCKSENAHQYIAQILNVPFTQDI